MEIAIKIEEGVTILLSEEKMEKLVKDNYGENAVVIKKETIKSLEPVTEIKRSDDVAWRKWSEEEDEELKKFLEQYGGSNNNYKFIANKLNRTFEAIKTRASYITKEGLEPAKQPVKNLKKFQHTKKKRQFKTWKPSEEKKLIYFLKKYGSNVKSKKEIAEILNRSEASIRLRYSRIQRGEVKVKKTPESYGFKKKSLVFDGKDNQAKDSPDYKTCKECGNTFERQKGHNIYMWNKMKFCNNNCRSLYHQKLHHNDVVVNSSASKKWTETEDNVILKEVKIGGRTMNNYIRISKLLGRTMNSIQARFSILSRSQKENSYGEAVKGVSCPECKSTHIRNKGLQHNSDHDIRRYQCGYCRKYFYGDKIPVKTPVDLNKIKNVGGGK